MLHFIPLVTHSLFLVNTLEAFGLTDLRETIPLGRRALETQCPRRRSN